MNLHCQFFVSEFPPKFFAIFFSIAKILALIFFLILSRLKGVALIDSTSQSIKLDVNYANCQNAKAGGGQESFDPTSSVP